MRISLFFLLLSGLLLAQTHKDAALSNDTTLQESSRKSILGFGYMGVGATQIEAPTTYYPYKGEAQQRPNIQLSTSTPFFDGLAQQNFDYLITDRYDKIILGPTTSIITPLQRLEIANPAPVYTSQASIQNAYMSRVQSYLDGFFGKTITYLLSQTLDARYQALKGIEKTSFITTKAKEVGVPVEMLEQLMGAAYSFSLYATRPVASVSINQLQNKDDKGNIYYTYAHNISVSYTLQLIVYRFDANTGRFEHYTTIDQSLSKSAGQTLRTLSYDGLFYNSLFESAIASNFKAGVLALQVKLKNDKNFAMHGTVTEASLFSLAISPGIQESIRTDQPFKIMRSINDDMRQIGWLKAITPGNTCLKADPSEHTTTTARLISGLVEQYDQVVEYGYSGAYYGVAYTKDPTIIAGGWGGANGNYLTLEGVSDLGYMRNDDSLSEIYGYSILSFGLIDSINKNARPVIKGDNSRFQGLLGANLALGVERRWYLFGGLGIALGTEAGVEAQLYDGGKTGQTYTDDNGDTQDVIETLTVGYLYLRPHVKATYSPDPYLTLYAQVAYAFDVSMASISYSKETNPTLYGEEIGFKGMLQAMQLRFGLSMHIDFIGDMANSYQKSNGACNRYNN